MSASQFLLQKTAILLLAVTFFCNSNSYAQFRKGDCEISLGDGWKSSTELVGFFLMAPCPETKCWYTETANSGIYFGTFRYFLRDWLSLGLTAGVQTFAYSHYIHAISDVDPIFRTKGTCFTAAVELKTIYRVTNVKGFQMYHIIGFGATFYSEKETPNLERTLHPVFQNLQWSPLCVRYGENFAVFIETGFGYKGIISGGLSCKISKVKGHYY